MSSLRIDELIEELERVRENHGNLEVLIDTLKIPHLEIQAPPKQEKERSEKFLNISSF